MGTGANPFSCAQPNETESCVTLQGLGRTHCACWCAGSASCAMHEMQNDAMRGVAHAPR